MILILFSLALFVLGILRLNYWGDQKADLNVESLTILDIFWVTLILASITALIFSIYILTKIIRVSDGATINKWVYYSTLLLVLCSTLGIIAGPFIEANFIQVGLKQAF